MVTTHDFLQKTFDAILQFGLLPPANHIITDGEIHRVPTVNSRGQLDGFYAIHSIHGGHYYGLIGMWREGGRDIKYRSWDDEIMHHDTRNNLNKISAEKIQRSIEKIAIKKQQCIDDSIKLWESASREGTNDYLVKKRIKPYGARFKDGLIIVPVHDIDLNIKGLQKISVDKKLFETGTAKKGNGFLIGRIPDEPCKVLFCEGYATGASLHEAVSLPVVVCFDAGNLEPVIKEYRDRFPLHEFVICADNDQWNNDNPGIEKANYSAELHNCKVVSPVFNNEESKPTDFNDLAVLEGLPEVKLQVMGHDRVILQDCELPIKHLGELCALIESYGSVVNHKATQHGALAFIAHIVAGRVITSSGDKCSLFVANTCDSNGDLHYIDNAIEGLLHGLMNEKDFQSVRSSPFTAINQLSGHYYDDTNRPVMLYLPYELGEMVRFSRRQPSGVAYQILSEITQIARKPAHAFLNEKGNKKWVQNPIFNMYANFNGNDLFNFAKTSELNGGLLPLFIVQTNTERASFVVTKRKKIIDINAPVFKPLVDHCLGLLSGDAKQSQSMLGSVKVAKDNTPAIVLSWERDPSYYYKMFSDLIDADNHDKYGHFIHQGYENAKNMAGIITRWNLETVIKDDVLSQCVQYVIYRMRKIIDELSVKNTDDVAKDVKSSVLDTIYRAGDKGIAQFHLLKNCVAYRKLSTDERQKVISELTADGDVIEKHNTTGRPGVRYFSKLHVS